LKIIEINTFLVFTTSGGMEPECTIVKKRLAEKIAEKCKEPYASVMACIRTTVQGFRRK